MNCSTFRLFQDNLWQYKTGEVLRSEKDISHKVKANPWQEDEAKRGEGEWRQSVGQVWETEQENQKDVWSFVGRCSFRQREKVKECLGKLCATQCSCLYYVSKIPSVELSICSSLFWSHLFLFFQLIFICTLMRLFIQFTSIQITTGVLPVST